MSREILLPRARELIAPDIDLVKPTMLEFLRATSTAIDGEREQSVWSRGSFFHPIQDTTLVDREFLSVLSVEERNKMVTMIQACFVKDLDWYFIGLPAQERDIREVLQTVYDAGISFSWEDDLDRVEKLDRVFKELNTAVLLPWVHNNS